MVFCFQNYLTGEHKLRPGNFLHHKFTGNAAENVAGAYKQDIYRVIHE